MRKIIGVIADRDNMFELKPRFGRAPVTALPAWAARWSASSPTTRASAVARCRRRPAADHRLQVMCGNFNIPLCAPHRHAGLRGRQDAERSARLIMV
jgi:hypothetical protein